MSEDQPTDPAVTAGSVAAKSWNPFTWTERAFKVALFACLGGASAVMLVALALGGGVVLKSLSFLLDNLPLTLPVLSVAMNIMLRPYELHDVRGWLKLSNPFAMGLVSFAIWAFVAGQGVDQFIRINHSSVLDKQYALLLVFGSFIWAGFCSVVTALAEMSEGRRQRVWRLVQVALVAVSITFLFAPFYLFEDKSTVEARTGKSFDERPFAVAVPYRDPGLNQYLGRSADPITQTYVYRGIVARTPDEAVKKAIAQFMGSDLSLQFVPVNRRGEAPRRVELLETSVVAAPIN